MVRTLEDIQLLERSPLDTDSIGNTWSLIQRAAQVYGDAPALSFFHHIDAHQSPQRWTYAAWLADINRVARLLRCLGVQRGDVVALVLPNLPATHLAIWGAETAGIAFVLNPMLEGRQIGELLRTANASWVITTAPEAEPEIWSRVAGAIAGMTTLRGVLAVDPLHGVAERGAPLLPATVAGVPVLDFHTRLAEQSGDAPDFELPQPYDTASYFCTGGTTGLPKIACRTHRNEIANCLQMGALCGDSFLRPGKTVLSALPLFHVNAVIGTGLAVFAQGGHVLLAPPAGFRAPGFVPRFWEVIEQHRVSAFSGVPTVYATLLQMPRAGRDISSLSHAICGAAPMPVELINAVERETGMNVLEAYGLTESTCLASANPSGGIARAGSIGLRAPWQAMRTMVLDGDGNYLRPAQTDEIGVVCLSGPNVFTGYLSAAHNVGAWIDAPGDEGQLLRWFNTGDLGRMDGDGYFWLTGRKKELIIRGGHNIDPRQIEEALAGHPAVALCAAVGRPDAHAGEVPVAYVQLRQGVAATENELLAYAGQHIAERAALPKAIVLLPELPVTSVGKTYKPALLQREVEGTVRATAIHCDAPLAALAVEQDSKRGMVARYRCADHHAAALAQALGVYTFHSERIA